MPTPRVIIPTLKAMGPSTQNSNENDELLLGPNHAQKIHAFRDTLRSKSNETDKFQACMEMRDQLLDQKTELELICARMEDVMLIECVQYKEEKRCWSKRLKNGDTDAERWERFIGVAKIGAELMQRCLPPLSKTSGYWGKEKVQHYGWASAGEKYCKVLGTAASRVPTWEEALIKLNQLILRRINIPGRRPLRLSANPIDLIDLENLKTWLDKNPFVKIKDKEGFQLQYRPVSSSDLPNGYSFDQYGLIVSVEVADWSRPAVTGA
ncbi:hypothetical protein AOQ84DRAFT_309859, partial [Glonium stellatum]